MLADWLARVYPDAEKIMRVWLGPIGYSAALARAGVSPRVLMPFGGGWADALILGPGWTRIVEACVVLDPKHVGALESYVRLFRQTPEFRDRWNGFVIGTLLYAYPRAIGIAMARDHGFELVPFRPPYIQEYYREITGVS